MFLGPEIFPRTSVKKIIIFLHGYGSNGSDLISIGHDWQSEFPSALFFSPNAIEPWEGNIHSGYQWFGLDDLNPLNLRQGLDRATPVVANYIKQYILKYQLSEEDVALVGFSQGAMLALDLMFHFPKIGGVVSFSGAFYPPTEIKIKPLTSALLVHGKLDVTVPYVCMLQAEQMMKKIGIDHQLYTCDGLGHGIDQDGIFAAGRFLKQKLYGNV